MENMRDEILRRLGDLVGEVRVARAFVEAGKEIACERQLQGVSAKLLNFIEFIKIEDSNVAQETTKDK